MIVILSLLVQNPVLSLNEWFGSQRAYSEKDWIDAAAILVEMLEDTGKTWDSCTGIYPDMADSA